jgi:hypothetical protein
MHSSISPVQSISVSPCGRNASRITMPFVDLNTFDEHFATLRLLSPFSRTISEQAGFANHTPPIFAFVTYLTCIRGRSGQKPESNLYPAVTRPVPPDALWRSERHSAVMLAEAGAPDRPCISSSGGRAGRAGVRRSSTHWFLLAPIFCFCKNK